MAYKLTSVNFHFLAEDGCRPNPCLHGGTCKNYGQFHKCDCPKGFKGKTCEGKA